MVYVAEPAAVKCLRSRAGKKEINMERMEDVIAAKAQVYSCCLPLLYDDAYRWRKTP